MKSTGGTLYPPQSAKLSSFLHHYGLQHQWGLVVPKTLRYLDGAELEDFKCSSMRFAGQAIQTNKRRDVVGVSSLTDFQIFASSEFESITLHHRRSEFDKKSLITYI
jgi:hypothetical protein